MILGIVTCNSLNYYRLNSDSALTWDIGTTRFQGTHAIRHSNKSNII